MAEYRCERCGAVFGEGARKMRDYGFDYECPLCGSDTYYEIYHCAECGAEIREEQSLFQMCEACEAEIHNAVMAFFSRYADKPHVLEFLQWDLENIPEQVEAYRKERRDTDVKAIPRTGTNRRPA